MKSKEVTQYKNKIYCSIKIIEQIATILKNQPIFIDGNLYVNEGGWALFLLELYNLTKNKKYLNQLDELINRILNNFMKSNLKPNFSFGILGIGWLIQYFINQELIDIDASDFFPALDDFANKFLIQEANIGNFDLMYGASGAIIYLLERNKQVNRLEKITHYLELLIKNAKKNSQGIYWESTLPNSKVSDGLTNINMGLPHGLPGILSILVEIKKSTNQYNIEINQLLHDCSKFILSNKNRDSLKSTFPYAVDDNKSSCRLAWCYGDISVALSLFKVGISLEDTNLINESKHILHTTLYRKSKKDTGVVDACLCHGSAGLSILYKKIYGLTGEYEFLKQHKYWANKTIKLYNPNLPNVGYRFYTSGNKWEYELGLLEGITGVGLSIINHLSDKNEFCWDSSIFI